MELFRAAEEFEADESDQDEFHCTGHCITGPPLAIGRMWHRELQPQALVVFTDLEGCFPNAAPSHPVLWAATKDHSAPFGEVISMATA